jgi:membrane-associated PAP2 superfamily phosphatase
VCFPAGHSSAGFAWVSLYFFALLARPAWRWRGLAVGLVAGGVFGLAQQLRGAHFLSHDLWTLATCWALSLGLYLLVQRIAARPQATPAIAAQGEAA